MNYLQKTIAGLKRMKNITSKNENKNLIHNLINETYETNKRIKKHNIENKNELKLL